MEMFISWNACIENDNKETFSLHQSGKEKCMIFITHLKHVLTASVLTMKQTAEYLWLMTQLIYHKGLLIFHSFLFALCDYGISIHISPIPPTRVAQRSHPLAIHHSIDLRGWWRSLGPSANMWSIPFRLLLRVLGLKLHPLLAAPPPDFSLS